MVFDEQELLKYTEDDKSLSSELMAMAVCDIPDFLNNALYEREGDHLLNSAEFLHKIKGIAGCIGAVQVHSLAAELELSLKIDSSPDQFDRKIGSLEEAVSMFIADRNVQKYLK